MKNNIKALVNQVKKALANKASFGAFEKAYADVNGGLVARSIKDNADIMIFVGGIVSDLEARNKVYDKNALTLAAETGIFKGGADLPENYADVYELPTEEFLKVGEIAADDLKAAAYTASADNTRQVLTAVHIAENGMIESCDGFRAYRKQGAALNPEALTDFEKVNGLLISAAAAAYGFKGKIQVFTSEKYIKLEGADGLTLFVRKLEGQYINLETIYKENYKVSGAAVIKNIKEFAPILKTAAAAKEGRARGSICLRIRSGYIDYYIPSLDIFGSIEAETEVNNPDFYITLNPKFLTDAIINQGCNKIEFQDSKQAPIYISGADNNKALVLPIRDANESPFERMDAEANKAPEIQEAEAPTAAAEAVTPAADPEKEAEAIAAINARQNIENKFVNIDAEAVKKEMESEAAAAADDLPEKLEIVKRETIAPEVIRARAFYKELTAARFTPSVYQETEAEAIYKNNRDILHPIARKAGGLYIDTIAIIAAIMAAADDLI